MIDAIDFKLTGNNGKYVKIALNGKNLIITGANGCGKTRLLLQLHGRLLSVFDRDIHKTMDIQNQLDYLESKIVNFQPSDPVYNQYKVQIQNLRESLASADREKLFFRDLDSLFLLMDEKKFLLRFYEANRLTDNIGGTGHVVSLSSVKQNAKNFSYRENLSHEFENYLVSLYNYASHVIAREENLGKVQYINEWFDKVQNDLCSLFEDPGLRLKYNPEEQTFYIHQNGKDPYRFNNLSSGYGSIIAIYADLLMSVELHDLSAHEITGIVLIDEIDAHLHVSIQRKIFAFFNRAFPKIQFIITTHSPFVVQSVNDAIIYDLGSSETLEDLSMYSYNSILKGLLGVDSTSDVLIEKLIEMANIVKQKNLDEARLKELVNLIYPHFNELDSRSKAFFLQGKNKLLDASDGAE
ncbi:AAA family ATPase [Aliamphritea hakodatensis]|uniref:AAA family ATPase n=1 Tax=Aliamphritea hakodatensis TaxID=2895352 RepID=UPI0022FD5E86|nr:AAA family ATPase [Aliamphritea hakodatensis]